MNLIIKNKGPIMNKYFILSLLLSLSLLIVVGAYLYYKKEEKLVYKEKSQDLEVIAKLKISELISWRKERIGDAEVMSQLPILIDFMNNGSDYTNGEKLTNIFNIIYKVYDYDALFIFSNEGELIYSVGSNLTKFDAETRKRTLAVLQKNSIAKTDFYYCQMEKVIHYDIIAPVTDENKNPIAVVVLRIDPKDFLYPYIQSWPIPSETSETLILQEENDSVLFLNELRHQKNTAFSLKIPLTELKVPAVQAIKGYTGIMQGIDYRGKEVIAYVSPIEGTNWYMVSKVDRSEILEDLHFKVKSIVAASIFLLLFFGVGIALFYNSRQKNIFRSMLQVQEEFRTTLYSIGDAVITTDIKGYVKQMNKVAEQLTGWSESSAKGKFIEKVFRIINEETRTQADGPFQRIMKDGKIVGLANHTILISKLGKEIPISDSGAPIKNEKGKLIGTILVFRDQTEERKTQKLIATRLALLEYSRVNTKKAILNKAIEIMCELTHSAIGRYYNIESDQKTLHLQTLVARTSAKFGKINENDLYYPIDITEVWNNCIHQKVPVISKKNSLLKVKAGRQQEHYKVVRELVVPVVKEDLLVAIVGVGNKEDNYDEKDIEIAAYIADLSWEISERKKADELFEEEKRMLTSLINSIPDSIYFKDKDCRFIRINNALSARIGLKDPQDAIGKNDSDFYGKEHSKQTFIDEKRIIETGNALVNIVEKEDWEDGKITWVSTTKVPLRDVYGNITGIMGISRDITEQQKLKDEIIAAKNKAEESDRLKSAFLANMSHEIRTPLNGILGFTQILLSKKTLNQNEKDHYSSVITKCANGLLQVIDDILDISRIEAGDFQIEMQPFKVEKTLVELNTIYSNRINEMNKSIKLVLSSTNHIIIRSDENRFRQIFMNLLDNAVKFTTEGEIKFGMEKIDQNEIIFFVSDTGIGISENMYDRVFERFRQVDGDSTREYGGNGLGLSIVKKLVELMNGKIWIQANPKGGSIFRFSFPCEGEISASSASIHNDKQQLLAKTNKLPDILLVEDDSINRMYIEEILENKCQKLVSVVNGRDALTKLRSEHFDLILMDIRLPDTNGYELVKNIRKFDKDIYIIAQTAYAMHSDEENAKSSGCNDYISKPINIDLLLEKLSKI